MLLLSKIAKLRSRSPAFQTASTDIILQSGWMILPQTPEKMVATLPEVMAVASVLGAKPGWVGQAEVLAWLPESAHTMERLVLPRGFWKLNAFANSQPQLPRAWSWWLGSNPWLGGLLAFGWLGSLGRIAVAGEVNEVANLQVQLASPSHQDRWVRTVAQIFRVPKPSIEAPQPLRTKGCVVVTVPDMNPESRRFQKWSRFIQALAAKEKLVVTCSSLWRDKVALVLGNPGFGVQVEVVENTHQCERVAKNCRLWIAKGGAPLLRSTHLGCQGLWLGAQIPEAMKGFENLRAVGAINSLANPSQLLGS